MRLDLFLKLSRLVKRRTVANELSEAGAITVNGLIAKPAKDVKVGDVLVITGTTTQTTVEVLDLPRRGTAKGQAADCYRVVSERQISVEL